MRTHLRWFLPFAMLIVLILPFVPTTTSTQTASAQGIFGCPFDSQRDCDLFINAVENTAGLSSVNVDELSLNMIMLADNRPTSLQALAAGPTYFNEDGDISDLDWDANLMVEGVRMPFYVRNANGTLYFDVEPNNVNNAWLSYNSDQMGTGFINLSNILTLLTIDQLVETLNEVGDGVTWSRGEDITVNGQPAGVFYAEFSSASLVTTSFAYEQLTLLLTDIFETVGVSLDANTTEFILDFVISTLRTQMGGADFQVTWIIGLEDELLHSLNIAGGADLNTSILSLIGGELALALPNELNFNLEMDVALSQHNAAPAVTVPENIESVEYGAIEEIFGEFLDLFLGDLIPSTS